MIKNLNFILKKKSIYKYFFYLFLFFIIIFFSYFFTPKFFNYSSQQIEESFRTNNDINIKNISKINYKAFPTPRLKVSGSNFSIKENILEIDGNEIEIILNPSNILNYKKLFYNKIIIKGGSTKINISNINQLLNYFKKNKLKIFVRDNNLILVKNDKFLFEINDSKTEISKVNNQLQLSVNGIFLNHKIIFLLDGKSKEGNNIIIKIPKLDIISNIFLENENKFGFLNGFVNVEILNNFFQFNYTREKNIKINKGSIRNNLINSSLEGEVKIKPSFLLNLTFEPTTLNMEKLFTIIQKKYFSDETDNLKLLKKINGTLTFKKIFQGTIIFENGEILFKNIKTGINNSILLDARISEFGKKGQIHFNILKTIQYRKSSPKALKISGFIVPSTSKVVFEKILFDKEDYKEEKIRNSEEKFNNEVVQKSLSNIFNDSKINNFFNNFSN
jgi:hypothetical protein